MKTTDKEKKIRKEIFGLVASLVRLRESGYKFIPGESDVHYAGRVYDSQDVINLVDASLDFWLTAGRYAREFEKKFAEFLNVKYCILTNSGSSANLLAVCALTSPLLKDRRLKPGDEVITTACGFPTTLNPILQNKCVPVFVDVSLGTYNIDADRIERAVSGKTKAIFVAHTLGNPIDADKVVRIAKKHRLWLIEDNCDALGSLYGHKYTGTFGHVATCSFYPPHHMTMGEGGCVLTPDALLRKIILSFRDWGRDCWCDPGRDNTCCNRFMQKFACLPKGYDHKYVYSHIGYNLKVTDMQAAIGMSQLKKLNSFIKTRRRNFAYLYEFFSRYEEFFILPEWLDKSKPSWFGFPLLVRDGAPFSRDEIVRHFEDNKVATRMLFGGNLTKQPAYMDAKYRISGTLKNTNLVMNNLFWMGVYPGIKQVHRDYILKTASAFLNRYKTG